jgi:hypothetical protein
MLEPIAIISLVAGSKVISFSFTHSYRMLLQYLDITTKDGNTIICVTFMWVNTPTAPLSTSRHACFVKYANSAASFCGSGLVLHIHTTVGLVLYTVMILLIKS